MESDGITLYYRGCRLEAGLCDGRPVAVVHHDGRTLARFEGATVIDCANQAKSRIDQMRRHGELPPSNA